MFCQNCGIEIKNPEMYCPNCGAKLEKEEPVYEEKKAVCRPVAKKKTKAGKWILVPVCIVIGIGVVAVTMHNRKPVIDLNDCYTIETWGSNGDGSLDVNFDEEKFREKYADKIALDEKGAEKWLKEQYGEDDTQSVEIGMNLLKEYDPVELVIEDLEDEPFELSQYDELSNGDKVTFTYNEDDEEILSDIERLYGCEIKKMKSYTVKGLEK